MFFRRLITRVKALLPASKGGADTMLLRELAFDGLQTSLKFAAYWLSGSQAMKAEFMRASVDCLNHITLYKVNAYAEKPPDSKHNYGYERYRNIAAFLPSLLFFSSGAYNVLSQLNEMLVHTVEPVLTFTTPSLTVRVIDRQLCYAA